MPGVTAGAGPLVVLKFGGSVLARRERLGIAVHEIYRWRRQGWRVLAVVSALGGRTDALLALAREVADGGEGGAHARAALLGTGELESGALLALHLDRAGVPALLLSPGAVGLTSTGDPEDATPVRLDRGPLESALRDPGVVVMPGFLSLDPSGRTVLLGRGGSDTTALFLSHALGAERCRLIKDVPALYERDPAGLDPPPRRFVGASWDDALATDGSILQHKAVRLARRWGRPFELAGPNGAGGTEVGPAPSVLVRPTGRAEPTSVVLLGLGTVGQGVASLLGHDPGTFRLLGAAVRSPERHTLQGFPLTRDPVGLAGSGARIVIEAMGGVEPALSAARSALRRGAHFITANKSLLAAHGRGLRAMAREFGGSVRGSAAVGGSAPVLEAVALGGRGGTEGLRGILNGTTNFVLTAMDGGVELEAALEEARRRGYAERDAARDLSGLDAAEKLCVVAQACGWEDLRPEAVAREPLDPEALERFGEGRERGGRVRQVATLDGTGGTVRARVALELLDDRDPLASILGAGNGAVVRRRCGGSMLVRGLGAGRWPTAEAVVADALEVVRALCTESGSEPAAPDSCRLPGQARRAPSLPGRTSDPSAAEGGAVAVARAEKGDRDGLL